ncbi:diacylglycerol kinase family lipid kinase [soil metagenome]
MDIKKALVIMNPKSGQGDHEELRQQVEAYLTQAGVSYDIRETAGEQDAFGWARDAQGYDLVLVSGGDGTVMEVMSGLIKNEAAIPLAQLPAGTANLLARALAIPTDPAEALELALNGVVVPLDVGYLPDHDRYFALIAGAGWDAQLIEDASRTLKDRFGFFAYVLTGVKNLFQLQRSRIELDIDGKRQRFRAHTVMVMNVGEIAGTGIKIGEDISPHDGKLNLAIASPNTLGGVVRLLYRLATGQLENYRDLRYFSASTVRITATPPLEVQIDGEALGQTPLYAEAVPEGALLVVPASYATEKGLKDVRDKS